jgi:hypothetical protein
MADTKVNVSFLKGTQGGFDSLSSYVAGAFYLTTDTHRLYFADSTTKANYLNKYVHTVSSVTELTTAINNKDIVSGDFAYIAGTQNALVVVTDTGYKQINAYKNTNTLTDDVTFVKDTSNAGQVTFNFTLKQTTYDLEKGANAQSASQPADLTASFTLTADDIKDVIKTAVDVNAAVSAGTATVKTSGTGSAGDGFTIKGAGSVAISGGDDSIIITGTNTKYDLTSPANETKIHLVGDDNSNDAVEITQGKQIVVSGTDAGKINIAHDVVNTDHTNNTTASPVADNATFTAINSITTDNGHLTGYTTQTYKLPTRAKYEVTTLTAGNDGKLTVGIKDANSGASHSKTTDATFFYTVGKSDAAKKTVYNQGDLDVYTSGEIDAKLKAVNAMVYKGTVGGTGATFPSLPTTGVSIGDTYKVAKEGTYAGQAQCEVGDIFIASIATGKTEGSDGFIAAADIVWTYIPAGDDYDAKFSFATIANSNKIKLVEDGANKDKGFIAFTTTADDGLEISTTASGSNNENATVNIEHKDYATDKSEVTATQSVAGGTFTAITGVTTDKGHLTDYTLTTYKLPIDKDSTYDLSAALAETDKAKIVLTGGGTAANAVDNVYIQASRDLDIESVSSNTIKIRHDVVRSDDNDKNATASNATGTVTTNATTGASAFSAITGVKINNTGHVVGVEKSSFTIPAVQEYKLSGAFSALTTTDGKSGFLMTDTLTGSKGASGQSTTAKFGLVSSSLSLSVNANNANAYNIDLVWGSF